MLKTLKLNSGHDMPLFGLGTWKSGPGAVKDAVTAAIDLGYRHIDCAHCYQNEAEVGQALTEKMADGTIKREDIFVTSKLWNTFHSKNLVLPALKVTLKNLGLEYLDMYLIHWPMGFQEGGGLFPKDENDKFLYSDVDYVDTWQGMEEAVKLGLVRSIGVSNFSKAQIERVIEAGTIVPATNQVECHPQLPQNELIEWCRSKGITITAYSPLGSPDRPWAKPDDPVLMEHPTVLAVANELQKSPAQVLIAFQLQRGIICIPKSVTRSRIEANAHAVDLKLSEEQMKKLASLECNGRMLLLDWVKDHPHYPFNTPF